MRPAIGETASITRAIRVLRRQGESWMDCRNGIIAKTPKNLAGKCATTIWYGVHRVSWDMIEMRPSTPKMNQMPQRKD